MISCQRCGRPLSDSHSVSIGYGPVCAKLGGVRSVRSYSTERPVDKITNYLNGSVAKPILIRALLTGLTIANPTIGGGLTLLYTSYSYYKTGKSMWSAYNEWEEKRKTASKRSIQSASGDVAGYATGSYGDEGANYIVKKAQENGIIQTLSKETKIDERVITDMLRGTSSEAINDRFSDLANFGVGKALGV